jgi:hypothetical protein
VGKAAEMDTVSMRFLMRHMYSLPSYRFKPPKWTKSSSFSPAGLWLSAHFLHSP